jgi:hypothetical protein
MPKPLVAIKFFSGDYMDNILLDALTKIAEGTYPCTSQEAFIFTDIAQNIAREAVEKFNSSLAPTNKQMVGEAPQIKPCSRIEWCDFVRFEGACEKEGCDVYDPA